MYLSTFSELQKYILGQNVRQNEELMILVAEDSAYTVPDFTKFLNEENIKFFGGIYPALLVGNINLKTGFIVEKYKPIYSSIVFPYMMRFKLAEQEIQGKTAIVLLDGLSSKVKDITDTIYDKLGNNIRYIGGGAGFYNLNHKPCIFNNKGIFEDAAIVCIIDYSIQVSVKHGWNKLEGPYTNVNSEENRIKTLGHYNAYEIYKDVIEEVEGIRISKDDFFTYAKDHPFGMEVSDQLELVVRDPISVNENDEIICVADIPKNSKLYILKGDTNSLLSSSMQIVESCASKVSGSYKPLLFDCISRAMFLQNRFNEELNNIQSRLNFTLEGALSIGEIASPKNGQLTIHNKSIILGLLENK